MTFDDILGQDRALRRLKGLLSSGRVPGALLLQGPEGVGKKQAALAFAAALACAEAGCGACQSCEAAAKGIHPDVRLVDARYQALLEQEDLEKDAEKALDKQREWKVGTIREICGELQRRSFSGGWKTAVVDDAHRMNLDAQNALLKMLEEPPPKTLWILVSSQPGKLLPTVLSRSQSVAFAPLAPAALGRLLERQGLSARGLEHAGSAGAARLQLEAREAYGDLSGPLAPVKAAAGLPKELASQRRKVALALDHLSGRLRERWAQAPGEALDGLRELERLRRLLRQNVSPSLIVELAFLKMEKHG